MTVRLHHVAVTVTDMDAGIAWDKDLFGFEERIRDEHLGDSAGYAVVLGPPDWSMAVVLNHHPTNSGDAFDPTRTGLDHIGFVMPDRAALEDWSPG
jgi:catechol 2,3-dioxygenase-like lactoylglutathione lyase family enzyme